MEPADSALPRVYGQTVESSGQSWDGFLTFVFSSTGLESMWCLWSYGRRETIPLYLLKASKNLASNLQKVFLSNTTNLGWVLFSVSLHLVVSVFTPSVFVTQASLFFVRSGLLCLCQMFFNHDLFVPRETQPLLLPCGRVVLVVELELCLSCVFCSCVL